MDYNNEQQQNMYGNSAPAPQPPKKTKSRFGLGILVGVLITVAVLMVVAVAGIFLVSRNFRTGSRNIDYQEKLNTIKTYLDNYYLGEVDEETLEDALASGYLSGIGDKYAKYYSKEEFDRLLEETSGSYGGVGISILMNADNQVEVYKVFANTPASEAGVQVKDIIVEAAGERNFEDLDSVVSLVRGAEGTTVDVVVLRDGKEIKLSLERRIINMETVNYEMLDHKIGYIQITEFDTITVEQFNTALEELEKQGATSLIFDLRDNPGGDYDTVMKMADRVLPEGVITQVVNKAGEKRTETSDEEHKITLPLAVLINNNSASASELFTGAIKDYGIATLVGETSYGKGVIQSIFRLTDGSGLKFTSEEYLTPNGNHIDGIGVSPDIEVKIPEEAYEDGEITREEDTQLKEAIEVLLGNAEASLE